MCRIKIFLLCFILLTGSVLVPVNYAAAADEDDENSRNYTPKVLDSEIKFNKKNFFEWFGLRKNIPEENIIEELVFAHSKGNYDDYYFKVDFELKTQLDDGSIVTTLYSFRPIDLSEYSSGVIDNILVSLKLKDEFYEHVFDYREIVKNAEGFQEYDVTGKGNFTYNTVISQADFYFIDKADGTKYDSRRIKFTWDEDLTMQLCTKISFSWYRFPTEDSEAIEKEIGSQESVSGVDGFTSNGTDSYLGLDKSVWDDLLNLTVGVPAAVIAFVVGFFDVTVSLKGLIAVIFPFLPGAVCSAMVFLLIFSVIWGVFKIVKGFF